MHDRDIKLNSFSGALVFSSFSDEQLLVEWLVIHNCHSVANAFPNLWNGLMCPMYHEILT